MPVDGTASPPQITPATAAPAVVPPALALPQGTGGPPDPPSLSIWPAAIPIVGMGAITGVVMLALEQCVPALEGVSATIPSLTGVSATPEFATALLVWLAVGVAVVMTLCGLLAYALRVVCVQTSPLGALSKWGWRAAGLAFVLGYAAAGAAIASQPTSTDPLNVLHVNHLTTWPIPWFTAVANTLTAASVAALVAGIASLMAWPTPGERPGGGSPDPESTLQRLLMFGAGAMILGVVEIRSLYHLPVAALAGVHGNDAQALAAARAGAATIGVHLASFWGVVFTTALLVMYIPAAFVLATRADQKPATAARALAGAPDSSAKSFLQPLLPLLAAIAPLLAGAMAELVKSVAKLGGGD